MSDFRELLGSNLVQTEGAKLVLRSAAEIADNYTNLLTKINYDKQKLLGLQAIKEVRAQALESGNFATLQEDSEAAYKTAISGASYAPTQTLKIQEWVGNDITNIKFENQSFLHTTVNATALQKSEEGIEAIKRRVSLEPTSLPRSLEEITEYQSLLTNLTENPRLAASMINQSKDSAAKLAVDSLVNVNPDSAEAILATVREQISAEQFASLRATIDRRKLEFQKVTQKLLEQEQNLNLLVQRAQSGDPLNYLDSSNQQLMESLYAEFITDKPKFEQRAGTGVTIEDLIVGTGIVPTTWFQHRQAEINSVDSTAALTGAISLNFVYQNSPAAAQQLGQKSGAIARAEQIIALANSGVPEEQILQSLQDQRKTSTDNRKVLQEQLNAIVLKNPLQLQETLKGQLFAPLPSGASPVKEALHTLGTWVLPKSWTSIRAQDLTYISPSALHHYNDVLTAWTYTNPYAGVEKAREEALKDTLLHFGVSNFGTNIQGGYALTKYPPELLPVQRENAAEGELFGSSTQEILKVLRDDAYKRAAVLLPLKAEDIILTPIDELSVGKYYVRFRVAQDQLILDRALNPDGSAYIFDMLGVKFPALASPEDTSPADLDEAFEDLYYEGG